jgi:hypothetical protein
MENNSNKTSRRGFIKSAATAAAAFMIVPRHVLGGNGFTAPSDKLQVAGIGVGVKVLVTSMHSMIQEKQI